MADKKDVAEDEDKFKESIWSINPDWRGWFYGVLLFFGVAVSVFTVWTLCRRDPNESWIDIFDAVWNGIVGSVVVVWFVFQAIDWVTIRVKTLINKIMAWGDPYREKLREQARKEAEAQMEQARREAEEYQKRYNEHLRQAGVSDEQIQKAQQLSDALGPPPFPLTK